MSPLESSFNDEIELVCQKLHGPRAMYWRGYLAGLMRALFGETAVPNGQHSDWLDPAAGADTAWGYRDGYRKLSTAAAGPQGCPYASRAIAEVDQSTTVSDRIAAEAWENEGGS